VMWLWTTVGVAAEILFIVLPASLGWIDTVDVGLTRTPFSWTFSGLYRFLHDGAASGWRPPLQ
jgi:cytochrome c oxidase subunit 1